MEERSVYNFISIRTTVFCRSQGVKFASKSTTSSPNDAGPTVFGQSIFIRLAETEPPPVYNFIVLEHFEVSLEPGEVQLCLAPGTR